MKWMVSYQSGWAMCGNQTFDNLVSAEQYITNNRQRWLSASLLCYEPHYSGISEMVFVRQIVERQHVG